MGKYFGNLPLLITKGEIMEVCDFLQNHPGFSARKANSQDKLREIRANIARFPRLNNPDLLVFAAGSLGRFEFGNNSDLDLFLVHKGEPEVLAELLKLRILGDAIELNESLSLPEFSNDARFLKIYSASDLVTTTGNPIDDSENFFTVRMLLILESQWLGNEELYSEITESVLRHYLRDSVGKKEFRPLFLLNDLLRFWRTLCLNYEHRRNDQTKPWRKKNVNLKFGRMLTVFATVLCLATRKISSVEDFSEMLNCVPMERLSIALKELDDNSLSSRFEQVVDNYESFLAWKELDQSDEKLAMLRDEVDEKAKQFSVFLHDALMHSSISSDFRRYLVL